MKKKKERRRTGQGSDEQSNFVDFENNISLHRKSGVLLKTRSHDASFLEQQADCNQRLVELIGTSHLRNFQSRF